MKNAGGQFAPKLGGHFELESGAHFKLELGGQYHWNLQTTFKWLRNQSVRAKLFKQIVKGIFRSLKNMETKFTTFRHIRHHFYGAS